jgi:bifunctional non-homologous end joining protein LigD
MRAPPVYEHNSRIILSAANAAKIGPRTARSKSARPRSASVLAKPGAGIRFNDHIEADGPTVFAHACKLGLEGIVSKRKDSPYRSGPDRQTGLR